MRYKEVYCRIRTHGKLEMKKVIRENNCVWPIDDELLLGGTRRILLIYFRLANGNGRTQTKRIKSLW